jgi:hypothetical protein
LSDFYFKFTNDPTLMKKILKWILIVIIMFLVGLFVATKIMSKDIPTGKSGPAAEALADKILNRLNEPAWDSLQYISWTFFRGEHHYIWDKSNNTALIEWADYSVLMELNNLDNTIVKKVGNLVEVKEDYENLKQTAWAFWCNDSFWLCAPYKIRDKGTKRSLIEQNGKQGLLVTCQSGGTTPGDSYLWWVDETGLPTSYDMWTSIIPIKGINATWINWETLPGGAMIAKTHKLGPVEMSVSNVKVGLTLESVDSSKNQFAR